MEMRELQGCTIKMGTEMAAIRDNVDRSSTRDLPLASDCGDWREGMPIAVVGAGPSLRETLPLLKRFKNVMAAGGSHDWLVENGVYPNWTVVCDPDPVMANYLRMPWPHCKYLVASMCDEAVFRRLEGERVYLWDCGGNKEQNVIYDGKDSLVIGGGATVGTRAIIMAVLFGYWNIHLFGFDNCIWPGDDHHCFGAFTDPKEKLVEITAIRLGGPEGREFQMAGYMIAQLFDIKTILKHFGSRMRLHVHGDGAIAELMRLSQNADQEVLTCAHLN